MLQRLILSCLLFHAVAAHAGGLAAAPVRAGSAAGVVVADGVVEALRQSVIAAQVAGAVTQVPVKAGDAVKAGQVLAQIDARAARQEASASRAQVEAARAALTVAGKEFERNKQLFAKNYISQSALDKAEAQYQAAAAQAKAQLAQAGASQTQSGLYTVTAPYAGLVAELPLTVGEMAMPGRTLLTLYDPAAMRVAVNLAQEQLAALALDQSVRIEIPGLAQEQRWLNADKVTVLPGSDASTHTVVIRLDLPKVAGLAPGMFARVSLPLRGAAGARLYVPARALVRRAELFALYVVNAQGQPLLRQVRAGKVSGAEVEILAGVAAGEQVALDPLAAAQAR